MPIEKDCDDEAGEIGSDYDTSSSSSDDSGDDADAGDDDHIYDAAKGEVDALDALAARSAEAKKLNAAAKQDEATLLQLTAKVEDLQKDFQTKIDAGAAGANDPSGRLLKEITTVERIEELFPTMVAFLLVAEVAFFLPPSTAGGRWSQTPEVGWSQAP